MNISDFENDLLPCPFCGSEDISVKAFSTAPDCSVECQGCGAAIERRVPWGVDLTEGQHDSLCREVLLEAWNQRKGKQ